MTKYLLFYSLVFFVPFLLAEEPLYVDVTPGAWYEAAVKEFVTQKYLDASQSHFRPADRATRAEFIKLVVAVNGGILDETPKEARFADVKVGDWFFPWIEEAAREQWVKGDGDCAGMERCTVRPGASISRAEAAALMRRAFGLKPLGLAPGFSDSPPGAWFSEAIQGAADRCILRGDDPPSLPELRRAGGTRKVRPADPVNRAEMVVMLFRVDEGRKYPQC